MHIFTGLAEYEREQTLQRQAEGIAIAKAAGRYKGRVPLHVDWQAFEKQYAAWKTGRQTARETMAALNLQPNTFYRRVREFESR